MLVPQLSCGSAGNTYPSENIDQFIDNNKALIRRMYGELQEPRTKTTVRVVRTYRQERQRCGNTSATVFSREPIILQVQERRLGRNI